MLEQICPFQFVSLTQDWILIEDRLLPIALGDLNNDNQLDIITTNRDTNKINVFFGYGNGTFPTEPTISVASSSAVYSIVVANFDSDSWLDIAVANHNHNNIGIFLGYGNGTFASEITYSTGSSRPLSLSVHDFNNDKRLDIVVANDGTSNIGVFLGSRNGTFSGQITFSTGFDSLPHSIAVGDFNNDSQIDIAVANAGTNNIGVFLGNGNGTFSNQTTYSTGSYPVSIAVGDLNDDNLLDIVVSNKNSNNVGILLANGNGTFKKQITYSVGSGSLPVSVAVDDFNKDDLLDIIVASSGNGNLGLFLGNGDGTFSKQQLYHTDTDNPLNMVDIGDLNNDTWMDIVVSIDAAYNVGVFLGHIDENFTNQTEYSTGAVSYPVSLAVHDINKDTRLDIIVANRGDTVGCSVGVLLGEGDGTFPNLATYPTGSGSSPYSVAVGDFDNDTWLDIAVVNHGINNIGVFLGKGNGTFSTQVPYSTGPSSSPSSIAVGNFNSDTWLDIVVANSGSNDVGVFLGNGDGTFSTQVPYLTGSGSSPSSIAVGNFNSDTWLDIAVANYGSNNVGVFLGKGNGTFSTQVPYSTGPGSEPNSVAVGNFNNDTWLDIAVANYGSNDVGVFLGKGNGNFSTQVPYSTRPSSGPNSIAVSDFDNDTWLDIAVANYGSNNVGVFLGNGDGTFSSQTTYPTRAHSQTFGIAVGDFNNDNRMDITVANRFSFSVGIFLGLYNSPFRFPMLYSSGLTPTPLAAAVAHFNDDDLLDIVVANPESYNIGIYLNSANGTFHSQTLYSTGYESNPQSVAVGDFNNDKRIDIIVANRVSNNIGLFFGLGNGSFEEEITYTTGSNSGPYSAAVGDFNNDSRLDIVSANYDENTIILFLQYGFGASSKAARYSTGYDGASHSIAVGDFNNDTQLDMVATNFYDSSIGVLLGNGNGTFSTATKYSTGSSPWSVAVGDFNNDTRLDIVVANSDNDSISVFLGNGDGTFLTQSIYYTGQGSNPFSIAVGDFDNDTKLDIVVANHAAFNIGVFLGNGDGTFSTQTTYETGNLSWPNTVAVCELNNDGRLDIIVGNKFAYNVGVFLGNGDGTFSTQIIYPTGDNSLPIGVAAGDFNNDSRMDIAVANYGSSNIGVFLGNGNGTFSSQATYSTGYMSGPYWITVGDFNNDARLDIAAALSLTSTVAICLGDGNGKFSKQLYYDVGSINYPWNLIACDFNNDKWLDIAVATGQAANVLVFLGDRNRIFFVQIPFSTSPGSGPLGITVGDLNNDKNLDIAVTYINSNNVGVFLGYGDGVFLSQTIYSTGSDSQPCSVAVNDFNNDSLLDIVVTNRNSNSIGIFLGQENGTFRNVMTYSSGPFSNPVSVAILDFNRDNKLDIVVANNGSNSVGIFQGYGDGTFSNQNTYLTGYNTRPSSVTVGDINRDGWTDVVVTNTGTKNVNIFLKLC